MMRAAETADNWRQSLIMLTWARLSDAHPWTGEEVDEFVALAELAFAHALAPQHAFEMREGLDANITEQHNALDFVAKHAAEWAEGAT